MKAAKYKKHSILFLTCSIAFLLLAAILVYVADPFFQYHKPLDELYYLIDNKTSQNPGLAKTFTYDSVILGSSMTVNFDTDLFEETMGLNTLKLSFDGAYPKDIDNIMQLVKNSPNTLETVFLGIDIFTYKQAPGTTAYEIPSYLYDDSVINDVPYLLNKDIILDYILRPQFEQEGTLLNEVYWSWPYMNYGKEYVALSYHAPQSCSPMLSADAYAENITENLKNYIQPYMESMPDTRFVVFFPPYSILYWYDRYADGSLEAELAGEKQIIETLLAYPNVEIYYFQNQFDYITDLDNYCDYTHYYYEMNNYMTHCFAAGTHRLTLENYETVLSEMLSYMEERSFEAYVP